MPRVAKPFFILAIHSPPGAVGHMAASKAWSRGTHGSTGAYLIKEARSEAEGHVTAPELTSARRRGSGPRDTWQCQSSPQHGGEVRGRGTHGGVGAYLCREVWSEVTAYVVACECTPYSLS
jgi:hypothetical protein